MVNANCATPVGCAGVLELVTKSSCFLSLRPAVAARSPQYFEPALSSARNEGAGVDLVVCATGRTLVEFFATTVARSDPRMLEATMNSPATVRPPGRSRLALIVAGVLALLGSFAVTAPAQAGYYDDSNYGSNYGYNPCSYRSRCGYGYSPYRYARRYYNGCSACGCYRRCGSVSRSGVVYERRYVERQYVERRYGYGGYRRPYGYNPYGGYRRDYGYYPYGAYRGGYGYGGVGRRWTYGYQSSADGYEEPPRPPAQVWDGGNNY